MTAVAVGQPAPSFRLISGDGREIGPEDYRGRSNLIIWFTKGMACPFCRSQMSLFARGMDRLKAAGTEVIQVTPTKPERARFYVQNFRVPFPYLCDPELNVHRAWGLGARSHSLLWYLQKFQAGGKMMPPPSEVGDPKTHLTELPSVLKDTDSGLFALDRQGIVRYRNIGAYIGEQGLRAMPSMDEILKPLQEAPTS
jgi:peroxiredoxin